MSEEKVPKLNEILKKSPEVANFLPASGYAPCSHCGMVKRIFLNVKTTNPSSKAWQTVPLICNDCIAQVHKIVPYIKEEAVKEKFVEDKQKVKIDLGKVNALKDYFRNK